VSGKNYRRSGKVPFALALLCTGVTSLASCSSNDDQPLEPARTSSNETTITTTDEERQKQEEREREKEKGDFSRAGRLSDSFDGAWPFNYTKAVSNPSEEVYVGTISVIVCTPGEESRAVIPSSQAVTVPPEQTVEVEFNFSEEGVNSRLATLRLCVTLSDEGGLRDTDTDNITAQYAPQPETTESDATSAPEPGTPTPTADGTSHQVPTPDVPDVPTPVLPDDTD